MAKEKLEIRFTRDFVGHKKGQIKALDGDIAMHYVNNAYAELTDAPKKKGECNECKGAQERLQEENDALKARVAELKIELETASPKKKRTKL